MEPLVLFGAALVLYCGYVTIADAVAQRREKKSGGVHYEGVSALTTVGSIRWRGCTLASARKRLLFTKGFSRSSEARSSFMRLRC